MKSRFLGPLALAAAFAVPGCGLLPEADIPPRRVEAAEARYDALGLALGAAIEDAGEDPDLLSRHQRLERLSRLNDRLALARMLAVMTAAVPDHDGFATAERALGEVDAELATMAAHR